MICYKCGCSLSEHDFCTNCGADVTLYKKIIGASNYFYNDGLAKANIRDLSGAIASLRQCLKLNKNHVEARNLLGLIYFETGEVVAALSEWVISTNLRPKKNIAEDYINMIQDNQARLDTINATIKRYNQALASCQQDGLDIAVIQLKKVLSLNPKFVRAHQLLALLYINAEEWEKAQKELLKCKQIDHNNTLTLLYLKEVEAVLQPVEGIKTNGKRKKESDVVKYQSGNETIIQPINPDQFGSRPFDWYCCLLVFDGTCQNLQCGSQSGRTDQGDWGTVGCKECNPERSGATTEVCGSRTSDAK